MAKKLSFTNKCLDNKSPRIGGGALIENIVDWPTAPDGLPLTLVMSFPTSFFNENANLSLPEDHFISVFSYYSNSEYFLDNITYHGSQEELDWLRKGFTRVICHVAGAEIFGSTVIPAMVIEVDEVDLDTSVPFGGSKIGGQPSLLQSEPLELGSEQFALQVYGNNFPRPYEGIFGLSDAVAYLFLDPTGMIATSSLEIGTFFVQVT